MLCPAELLAHIADDVMKALESIMFSRVFLSLKSSNHGTDLIRKHSKVSRSTKIEAQIWHSSEGQGRFLGVALCSVAMRYTFGDTLIRRGANIKTAQGLMCHKTASMTLDVYAQYFQGDGQEAVDSLPFEIGTDIAQTQPKPVSAEESAA